MMACSAATGSRALRNVELIAKCEVMLGVRSLV